MTWKFVERGGESEDRRTETKRKRKRERNNPRWESQPSYNLKSGIVPLMPSSLS